MVILEQSKITYSGGYFPQTVNNNLVYLAQAMWYPTYLKYLCECIIGVIVLATTISIGYSTVGHGNLNLVMIRNVSIPKKNNKTKQKKGKENWYETCFSFSILKLCSFSSPTVI